ncbi:MAG: 30S ribosomal protein S12 methylthiotransferase RimO, partial [Oscillospiraceae bacterium]
RAAIPDLALRTTLLVGFPGESEADFAELEQFVREVRFERLGVFAYSEEEGTVAAKMENQIPMEVRTQRAEEIMQLQTEIMAQKQEELVGRTLEIICDEYDSENHLFICRSVYDAPEIDGEVYLSGDENIEIGDIATAQIKSSDIYDLYAELV